MGLTNSHPHIVGFWPLDEPSGSPIFKNLSHLGVQRPSGISFDWHVHSADSITNTESTWPGTTSFTTYSGVIRGLQCLGDGTSLSQRFTFNCLLPGHFTDAIQNIMTTPAISGSGFTIGGWIYPNADSTLTAASHATIALRNALIARLLSGTTTSVHLHGFSIGVSGLLAYGSQNPPPDSSSNDRVLTLFAQTGPQSNSTHLRVPIESGTYTHFAFKYTYIDGTSNEVKLYKNGNLEAQGTTNVELDDSNSSFRIKPLSIGGSETNAQNALVDMTLTSGRGNLISGVYYFDIPLSDSDILGIHSAGGIGLSPEIVYKPCQPVSILDSSLLAYYEFIGKGMTDSSKNREHISAVNDSISNVLDAIPGPFDHIAYEKTGLTNLIIPSGVSRKLINRSFTIGGWFRNSTASATTNHFWSIGDVSTNTDLLARVDFNSTRMRPRFTVWPVGDSSVELIYEPSGLTRYADRSWSHIAVTYNHDNPGTEIFIDGESCGSGQLSSTISFNAIARAGYTMILLGGNDSNRGQFESSPAYGDNCAISDFFIFNRLLNPDEIRGIAQSGIDTSSIKLTHLDPRLKAYWKCNEPSGSPIIFDYSAYGGSGIESTALKNHLVPFISSEKMDRTFDGATANLDKRLDYFNNNIYVNGLGITSGTFVPLSAINGVESILQSSHDSLTRRFNLALNNNNVREPTYGHDLALYFEVTPMGPIPQSLLGNEPGAPLFSFGSSVNGWVIFLTSINVDHPDNTICFQTRNGTNNSNNPLVSGTVTHGTTSNVLIRTKTFHDDRTSTDVNNIIQVDLFINGTRVQSNQYTNDFANITLVTAATDYKLAIGSVDVPTSPLTTNNSTDDGLLCSALREIAVFYGTLTDTEAQNLANNGIVSHSSITPEQLCPMTKVQHNDSDLQGYWRFSDHEIPFNSGLDLSTKSNDLVNFAALSAPVSFEAAAVKAIPFPFGGPSFYPVQASGIGFQSTTTVIPDHPPFIVSGVGLQSPEQGFTLGFSCVPNGAVTSNSVKVLMAYGPYANTNPEVPQGLGWAAFINESEELWFALSEDGGYQEDFATGAPSVSGAAVVGLKTLRWGSTSTDVLNNGGPNLNRLGYNSQSALQAYAQFTVTYDPISARLKAFLDGELIDQTTVRYVHTPRNEDKMITFLSPLTATWTFNSTKQAFDSLLSDVFYFSRPLDESEVRYIAMSGIALANAATSSGIVGGFMHGLGITSGIVGGFVHGFSPIASGIVGGFVRGSATTSGIVGGYIQGTAITSGIVGGFLQGLGVTSGIIGGFINGAVSGLYGFDAYYDVEFIGQHDFDAYIRLDKTSYGDFDAFINLYKDEIAPSSLIIVPGNTITSSPPYVQYFVGATSGFQDKSIYKTVWNYGDLTPNELGIPSGAHTYARNHLFEKTGIFQTIFKVTDTRGFTDAASRKIDLSNGNDMPSLTLTATPQEGQAPLSVQFSWTIEDMPANVTVAYTFIEFGDGQKTLVTNPIHLYTVPGRYLARLTVVDSRGFLSQETLEIGANT